MHQISCAYCEGSGEDPFRPGKCRVCLGNRVLTRNYEPVRCPTCDRSGVDPLTRLPCKHCRGSGVVDPGSIVR